MCLTWNVLLPDSIEQLQGRNPEGGGGFAESSQELQLNSQHGFWICLSRMRFKV